MLAWKLGDLELWKTEDLFVESLHQWWESDDSLVGWKEWKTKCWLTPALWLRFALVDEPGLLSCLEWLDWWTCSYIMYPLLVKGSSIIKMNWIEWMKWICVTKCSLPFLYPIYKEFNLLLDFDKFSQLIFIKFWLICPWFCWFIVYEQFLVICCSNEAGEVVTTWLGIMLIVTDSRSCNKAGVLQSFRKMIKPVSALHQSYHRACRDWMRVDLFSSPSVETEDQTLIKYFNSQMFNLKISHQIWSQDQLYQLPSSGIDNPLHTPPPALHCCTCHWTRASCCCCWFCWCCSCCCCCWWYCCCCWCCWCWGSPVVYHHSKVIESYCLRYRWCRGLLQCCGDVKESWWLQHLIITMSWAQQPPQPGPQPGPALLALNNPRQQTLVNILTKIWIFPNKVSINSGVWARTFEKICIYHTYNFWEKA